MLLRPQSLRQRTALYILAPVCVLLVTVEFIGFSSIKTMLLGQIQQTGLSHLQKTAQYIESRLHLPKTLLTELVKEDNDEVQSFLTNTIESLDGIIELRRTNHSLQALEIMPTNDFSPRVYYDPVFKNNTVLLHAEVQQQDKKIGYRAELSIALYDLIGQIPQTPWWSGLESFILDTEGNILSPVEPIDSNIGAGTAKSAHITAENKYRLQQLIKESTTGSMLTDDSGHPEIIYGYHTLKEAPYTMVVATDAASLLKPLRTFRLAYLLSSLGITAIVLFLLNLMIGRIIRTAKKLSKAAGRLAEGQFDKPLQFDRDDEIGRLVESFNAMSTQLQKGVQMQKALALAGEIQQSLLPQSEFSNERFEACGFSLPCYETGGDFFDILPSPEGNLVLIVGDVVGHGVGAALLMATTRALLRSEIEHAADLASCMGRVNRLLCRDTEHSGNFATTFLLSLDRSNRIIQWVRAGHEPAMLYNLEQESFTELRGKGIAIGIEPTIDYSNHSISLPQGEHLVLIGSDGLTDLEDVNGQRFGKKRLQQLIQQHAFCSAKEINTKITEEIDAYVGKQRPNDDITVVIVKIC